MNGQQPGAEGLAAINQVIEDEWGQLGFTVLADEYNEKEEEKKKAEAEMWLDLYGHENIPTIEEVEAEYQAAQAGNKDGQDNKQGDKTSSTDNEEAVKISVEEVDNKLKEMFPDTYVEGSVRLSNIPPATKNVSEFMAGVTNVGRDAILDLPFYLGLKQ